MSGKSAISMRVDVDVLAIIDRAAEEARKDRTTLLLESGLQAAERTLVEKLDRTLFLMPDEVFEVLDRVSEEDVPPSEELKQAAERHKELLRS